LTKSKNIVMILFVNNCNKQSTTAIDNWKKMERKVVLQGQWYTR